ncbi:alpha/beta hydrolase fold-domain-containing protein [Fomitopsis serialis]|uniref:alpha/beta hydrolase fold-domain-containing protein n=1 Tax=Fomitopsis serialis TaxID=139415 RepID=UPI002008A531|nr:alpha/beta hydrolase fold-domain-containing protein [Neoantrodia serialis]KAH9919094.1 alpha/beta hydrolase fold-domain-containing protein [Neoantrodia serialis]
MDRTYSVGKVEDIVLGKFDVRVYSPDGEAPERGWPVFIYFHGGEIVDCGWTLGNITTNGAFASNVCKRANCVVVAVNYRLAPENPYPAAVEDAVETLQWVYREGKERLNADLSRLAVGGSSSGGNLAAILAHKAIHFEPPIPLVFQLLVVPVIDNTASLTGVPYKSWAENANTVQLTPAFMLWFRDNYLPNLADRAAWESSPIYAPESSFKKLPKACVQVMELDILRDEGIAYAEKLRQHGIEAEVILYKTAPHPILSMDGVLEIGRRCVTDAVQAVARAFGTA